MTFFQYFLKAIYLFYLIKHVSCFIQTITLDHNNSFSDKEKAYWKTTSLIENQRKQISQFGISAWFKVNQTIQNNHPKSQLLSISTEQCNIFFIFSSHIYLFTNFIFEGERQFIISVVFDGTKYFIELEITGQDLLKERIYISENNKWHLLVLSEEHLLSVLSFQKQYLSSIKQQQFHNQSDIFKNSSIISTSPSLQLMIKDILVYSSEQNLTLIQIINIANQDSNCKTLKFLKRQLFCQILKSPLLFLPIFQNYVKIIVQNNDKDIVRYQQNKNQHLRQMKFQFLEIQFFIKIYQLIPSNNKIKKLKYIYFNIRLYLDKIQNTCFKQDQQFIAHQSMNIETMNQIIKCFVSSFYLNDLDIYELEEEVLFTINNQSSILIKNINNVFNLVIQIKNQSYHIGLIENLQNQITLQIEFENQSEHHLIIQYYSNEMLKSTKYINNLVNQFQNGNYQYKIQQNQYQKILIANLFVYANFKLKLQTDKYQQINQCAIEAYSIFQNQQIQNICIFHAFTQLNKQSIQIPLMQINQKRNLATIVYIHGSNMRSIVKKLQINQESTYLISSVQTQGPFMVIGYFKLTQSVTSSQPSLPLITIGVQSQYYNFLNLYIVDSTKVELKYIHDANNIIKKQSGTLSNFKDKWISFGIVYSQSDQKAKFVYNTSSNAILLQSTTISSATLPSTITNFDVCISCNIQGGVFNQFSGQVSSVKIVFDVNFNSVNQYYFFNEATTINKSTILNNSFNQNNYIPSNEYDVGQGFTCNSGYAFFEGVCIDKNNCQQIHFESDVYESFESGKFFNSSTNKCLSCGSNCLSCTSNTICIQCRPGYKLNSDKCIRCSDQNGCSSSCTNSQVLDTINQICIGSFDLSSQTLSNPLISSRIINDNTDIQVVPPFSSTNDIITHCYLDVDNSPITIHSFLGGTQFTSSILLKKEWPTIPKGYQKSVSFYVLFYGSGNPSNLLVKINSNTAVLDSSFKTIVQNKVSCSGSSSLTQSIFKVKFTIQDYQTFFNLEINSNSNSWGIRNLNIEILKCHPTCDTCKSGGSAYDCTTCKPGMKINKFQCTCDEGQYAKFQNCFDSPCVVCSSCSISNCSKCEDITGNCIQCEQNYSIFDGQCIQDTSCNTKNAKYFNYCGISSEDGFIHFNQNKILQYADYWKFNNNNFTLEIVNSQKFLSLVGNGDQHTLAMTLPNYQSYHFMLGFKILILAHQSIDSIDFAQIVVNNVQVFKKCYQLLKVGKWTDEYFSESDKFLNNNDQIYFKFISITDTPLYDEGYSFSQLEISYYRCHPICKSCNDIDENSCTNCIDNAYKNVNGSCQCKDGFYFSLVRYYTDSTPPGNCLKCNSACKTCTGPSYQNCILCQEGYKLTNHTCQYICQDGEYWDQPSQTCLNCHLCCRTCEGGSNTDCHDCNSDFSFRVQDKSCLIFNAQCQACTVAVNSLCGGDQSTHDACLSDGWRLIKGSCLNCGKYLNNQCGGDQTQDVINACKEQGFYNYDSNNCSSCSEVESDYCGRIEIKDTCKSYGWVKFDSKICKDCNVNSSTFQECVCHSSCDDCSQYFDPKACNTCQPSLYFFKNQCLQKCPNGYIIKGNECVECKEEQMPSCVNCFKTCLICDPFKVSNIPNSCTQCSNLTRKFVNGQCLCEDSEDDREIFYECSYQNIAVLNAVLSNKDSVLTIDFGKKLVIPNDYQQKSKELCLYLFTVKTIQLLESSSLCLIQDKYVIVDLGESANVFNGDFINFNENVLSFYKTPSTLINKFMNNVVVQDKIIEATKVQFTWTPIENSCNDFNFEFKQITEGAKRGFRNFIWSVKSFVPQNPSLQQALELILEKANKEKKLNIMIPKGIVQLGTQATILFTFTLKANVNSYEEFPLSVRAEKKIQIDFQTQIIFPLFRYQSGLVVISPVVKMCDSSGDLTFIEPIDFSITSIEYPDINYTNSNFNQQDYTIELKPYLFPASNIVLNVQAKLISNQFIESKADFNIDSQQTDLSIKIAGGDCYFNYKKEAIIQGKLRDLDIEKEGDPQEISISWECVDQNTSQICKSKVGNIVTLPNEQSTIKIEAFTFNPYTTIKVTLIGNKSPRQSKNSIVVLFSELDLPPLGVDISLADPKQKTVNINEEIYVILNYSSSVNVDLLSFSGTISYENEVVGIIKFDYTALRFQIWNYYSNFKRNSKDFQIRFNVFNPKYYMPSMFLSTLTLNFPPNNCKFNVTPTNGGFSLETKFMIIFQDCDDENQPISYQFFFYKDEKDFQFENVNPLQVLRRQITDKQQNPITFTSLPPGQILLLGQAIDSKNAIYNTTISITVEKKQYDEQSYLSIVQQKLDQVSKVSKVDAISGLSMLCDDILSRSEFNQSTQLSQKKNEIINELNTLQKSLSLLSSFSTVVDKATKSLIESGITYNNDSEQTDLLNNLIDTLEETSNLKQSSLELSKEKLKQKLFDSFQVINSMGKFSSETESGLMYLKLSDQIGQNFFKNILPNEDPIYFKGDNLSIVGSQMTEKYICSYFLCDDVNSPINESKTSAIYNFKKSQYNENPYQQDTSFQNYTNSLKEADPNLKITNYPVISPAISTQQNVPITKLQQEVVLKFPIQENLESKKLTCLSKDSNSKWTNSGCNKLYNEENKTFKCICKSLSPTTIFDDLEDLLSNSNIGTAFSEDGLSNIANFDEFYKYVAFWVLFVQTVSFYFIYNKGKKLDQLEKKCENQDQPIILTKQQQNFAFSKNKVVPLNSFDISKKSNQVLQNKNELLLEKEVIINRDILLEKNLQQQQNSQSDDKHTQNIFAILSPKENEFQQTQIPSINNSPQLQFIQEFDENYFDLLVEGKMSSLDTPRSSKNNDKISKSLQIKNNQLNDQNVQINRPQSSKTEKKSNFSQMANQLSENNSLTNVNILKSSDPKILNDNNNENIDTYKGDKDNTPQKINKQQIIAISEYQNTFKKLPKIKQILIFHNFFGIFLLKNPDVPRPLRSIHSLAISVVFDQSYSIVQKLAIAIINSVLIIIVVKILSKAFSLKSKIGIVSSRIISLIFLAGYYYIILSIISGQTPSDSNQFIGTFMMFYLGDIFVISSISAFCSKIIAEVILKKQVVKGILSFFYKAIELQMILLQLK